MGRQANPTRPNAPPSRGNTSSPSAYSLSSQGPLPSPSQSSTTMAQNDQAHSSNSAYQTSHNSKKNVPYFFREQCAGFVVKGNFMTLAAKPQLVEEGEWLAHQSRPEFVTMLSPHLLTCCTQLSSRTVSSVVCSRLFRLKVAPMAARYATSRSVPA